ncbi:MAG TPA: hypothetical protein VJ464_29950 [Blastocatellia bacterium]|nr:hypothetical protein [Blastocatellia bacterium]
MAKAEKPAEDKKPESRTSKKPDESAAASDAAKESAPASKSSEATASEAKAAKTEKAASEPASTPAAAAPDAAAAAGGTLDASLLPAQRGRLGVFGGPKDRGIKPDDKLGLPTGRHFTFERVRSLNPKGFYCAMRWDYHVLGKSNEEGKRWWANKKLLVTNPASGVAVVVRAVDYGPPESTGLAIAISPGAAEALGLAVGDEVEISFADPRLQTGIVQ